MQQAATFLRNFGGILSLAVGLVGPAHARGLSRKVVNTAQVCTNIGEALVRNRQSDIPPSRGRRRSHSGILVNFAARRAKRQNAQEKNAQEKNAGGSAPKKYLARWGTLPRTSMSDRRSSA